MKEINNTIKVDIKKSKYEVEEGKKTNGKLVFY